MPIDIPFKNKFSSLKGVYVDVVCEKYDIGRDDLNHGVLAVGYGTMESSSVASKSKQIPIHYMKS